MYVHRHVAKMKMNFMNEHHKFNENYYMEDEKYHMDEIQ
jgi:hypothetical protein